MFPDNSDYFEFVSQNFNIYKRLVEDLFAKPGLNNGESYKVWEDLRNVLYDLVCKICSSFFSFFIYLW